jgi:hypothetical protein
MKGIPEGGAAGADTIVAAACAAAEVVVRVNPRDASTTTKK